MTPEERASRLAEIEARHKAATPGDWIVSRGGKGEIMHRVPTEKHPNGCGSLVWATDQNTPCSDPDPDKDVTFRTPEADEQFIAHAKQDIPWMHAEIVRFERAYNQTVSELTQIIEVGDEEQRRLQAELSSSDIRLKEMVGLLREASNRLDRSLLSGSHHLGYYCTQCGGKEDESGCITHMPGCIVTRLRNAADQAGHKEPAL